MLLLVPLEKLAHSVASERHARGSGDPKPFSFSSIPVAAYFVWIAIPASNADVMLSEAKHLGFQGLTKTRFFACGSE
jgi:hypothetical protein